MSGEPEPKRLVEDGDAPAFLRDVVSAARTDRPSAEQLRSLAAGLSARIGAPIEGAAPGGATAGTAKATAGWATVGTKIGVVLVVAAGGAGLWGLASGAGGSEQPGGGPRGADTIETSGSDFGSGSGSGSGSSPDSGSGSDSDSGSGSGSGLASVAAPGRPSPAARPVTSPAPAPVEGTPVAPQQGAADDELSLLTRAQAALGADPASSLALVGEHERAWPTGTLAQEREVVAVEALVRLGRGDEARRRADAFATRYPASPYRRRLDVVLSRAEGRDQKAGPVPPIQP